MRRIVRSVLCAIAVLSVTPIASAKVRYLYGKTNRIEAVITRVSISDAVGDADYNFNLRPLAPGERSAFDGPSPIAPGVDTDLISNFWWLWDLDPDAMNAWRAHLAGAVIGTRGHFSEQCRQCAGTGPTGTACEMGLAATWQPAEGGGVVPYSYDVREHPCPKLFQCKECLYDMKRHSGKGFDDMSPNAEIFIQDRSSGSCSWNDLNGRLHGVMRSLGVDSACVELEWDDATSRWRSSGGGDVCGKHVLISGVRSLDQSHGYRPEIHPVTSMIIPEPGIQYYQRFSAATFIDGSYDSAAGALGTVWGALGGGTDDWTAEYYQLFRNGYVSPREDIYMSLLQGARPPSGKTANGIQSWAASCDHSDQTRHQSINGVSTTRQTISGSGVGGGMDVPVCPKLTVDMNPHECGAAWSAQLGAGWRDSRVDMVPTITLLTPQGIIADDANPPVDAPSRAECYKFGPDRASQSLKRWYRWEVRAETTYSNEDSNRISWLWSNDSNLVRLLPAPPRRPPQGRFTFSTWLPTPRHHAGHSYDTTLGSVLMMQQEESLEKSFNLRAPRPTIQISPGRLQSTVAANRISYAATLTAPPSGLCGNARDFGYSWRTNGAPSGNAASMQLTLAPGERKTVNVIGWDRWAVESAYDTRVFEAPTLDVDLSARCGAGSSDAATPYEAPGAPGAMGRASVCRSAVLAAAANETAGIGFRQRDSLDLGVRFAWPQADLKYMAPSTGRRWRAVPREWISTRRPKPSSASDPTVEETVIALPNETVDIQGTVTAADKFGRTATANVAWTNEVLTTVTAESQLRDVWEWARRGTPLPAPCGDPRGANCPVDPLARRAAWVRGLAASLHLQDPRDQSMLKRVLATFRESTFAKVAKDRRIDYTMKPISDFTTKRAPRISETKLQNDARLDFEKRFLKGEIQGLPAGVQRAQAAPVIPTSPK